MLKRLVAALTPGLFITALLVVTLASRGGFLTKAFRPESWLFYLESCMPLPCWHDIRPGETTLAEAQALLAADGLLAVGPIEDNRLFWFVPDLQLMQGQLRAGPDAVVDELHVIIRDRSLTLDRLNRWLGAPTGLQCRCYDATGVAYVEFIVYFPGNIVVLVQAPQFCDGTYLAADNRAATITLSASARARDTRSGPYQRWPGYGLINCPTQRL